MIISFVPREPFFFLTFFSYLFVLPILDAIRGIFLDEDRLVLHIAIFPLLFVTPK